MSVKKFFDLDKQETSKVIRPSALAEMNDELESIEYVRAYLKEKERFLPHIDFSSPKNFAKFGSAKEYYKNSISRIYNTYPYDGSLYEKMDWHSGSSFLDLHILKNEYPTTNGYVTLCSSSWGSISGSNLTDGYGLPENLEYIYIKSGPNVDNILAASASREENLRLDMSGSTAATGSGGTTVEFWLNKPSWANQDDSGLTAREVVFDLWNNRPSSSADYGRLTLELTGGSDAAPSAFLLTVQSGTRGIFRQALSDTITSASIKDGWNHYAVTVVNTGSNLLSELYVNGKLSGSVRTGTSIGHVTGSGLSALGALITSPSGNAYDNMVSPSGSTVRHGTASDTTSNIVTRGLGYGKLSGSLDEFRYWKTRRTGKEIGKFWFTQVGGGTNTDLANTDLGIYYKFNEGITTDSTLDPTVLDYSGRVSNGAWTGYTYGARNTGSAMVSASVAEREFEDPIVYSTHPDVVSFYNSKIAIGEEYDDRNNSSIYHSIPGWISEQDEEQGGNNLLKLTQVMSSYFDDLYLQIEALPKLTWQMYYNNSGSSRKPWPFTKELLESKGFPAPELFVDANLLEELVSRDEFREYEDKIYDIKNLIYNNIYNNLTFINKSKGTEKAFRNVLRCFGVSDELVKLNMYAHNATYTIEDNYRGVTKRKKYIDFNNADRVESTVYQYEHPGVPNSKNYVSSSGDQTFKEAGLGYTAEAEVIFPRKRTEDDPLFEEYHQLTSSLFGVHTVDISRNSTDTAWSDSDVANFQVLVVRPEFHSKDSYFMLTGTTGFSLPKLTSSLYTDVYDDEKWNFSVGLRPRGYPFSHTVTGATHQYIVEFYGVNSNFGTVSNEFLATGTIDQASAFAFLSSSKRAYVGAHRTHFTGGMPSYPTLQTSDVLVSSFRVWHDFLTASVIRQHAHDITNRGTDSPYRSAYLFENNMKDFVPQAHTLALDWDFETITGSNASGEFYVVDKSSGSTETRYGWVSDAVDRHHTGKGEFFPASSAEIVQKEYIYANKKRLPEVINSIDMIEIKGEDDQVFTKETRPIRYFFSIEKSMYQNISDEMINIFSSIKDFNNLIGDYKHQYRGHYKELEKLRQLFYENVESAPDIEKYIKYYKWIDAAAGNMLLSLIPASAEASDRLRVMVESHILERSKYRNKFPTLEMKLDDPEGSLRGINELLYPWDSGHAPTGSTTSASCLWWSERAERNTPPLTHGDSEHLRFRNKINTIITTETSGTAPDKLFTTGGVQYEGNAYAIRKLSRPYKYTNDKQKNIGGVDFHENKNFDFFRTRIAFNDEQKYLRLHKDKIESPHECREDLDLEKNQNEKLKATVQAMAIDDWAMIEAHEYLVMKDRLALPFNVISSSAEGGYKKKYSNYISHLDFANLHHDLYTENNNSPMQGPFTERYVGGAAHRHVTLNISGSDASGSLDGDGYDNIMTRPEGWWLTVPTSSVLEFTSLISDTFTASGWQNDPYNYGKLSGSLNTTATDPAGWRVTSSATPTVDTGPSGSFDGVGYYVYTETSYPNNQGGKKFSLVSPLIDAVDVQSHFSGTFKYHMYGQGIGKMYVQAAYDHAFTLGLKQLDVSWNGTTASYIAGQQHTSPTDDWHSASFNLKDFLDSKCFVRFVYEGTSDHRGDTAIDEISVFGSSSKGFRLYDVSYDDVNKPRAAYYREEYAKRPVNIKNIQQTASFETGSTIIGNYSHTYEVAHTVGRDENNLWFHDFADDKEINWLSSSASPYISGIVDFNLPTRSVNESVIVDRFSAPGGPEVMSRGYLDGESETYSVYNAMPYRNRAVRNSLNRLWSRHSAKFGLISTYSGTYGSQLSSASYETYGDTTKPITASYHKVNRNSSARYILSGNFDPNKTRPSSLTGGFGNSSSLELDGTSTEYARTNLDLDDFNFGDDSNDSPFTFSAWVDMDDATEFPIFSRFNNGGNSAYNYVYVFAVDDNDKLIIKCLDGPATDSSEGNFIACLSTGTMTAYQGSWAHFVATYNGGGSSAGLNLYVNGAKLGSSDVQRLNAGSYTAMHEDLFRVEVGRAYKSGSKADYNADGHIDEVSIWNKELSEDEVKNLYRALLTVGPDYQGNTATYSSVGPGDLTQNSNYPTYLVAWWRFGDHGSDPADDATGTVYDASTGSHNLSLLGSPPIKANAIERADMNAIAYVEYAVPDTASNSVHPYGLGDHSDNNFVTHQIPRSVRQYSWITASLNTHTLLESAPYEFETPTGSHAGGASSDITFLSASDWGVYRHTNGSIIFGISKTNPGYDESTFIPVSFAGLGGIIRDPITASSNYLGYPLGVPVASTVANSEQYVGITQQFGDGFVDSYLSAHPFPDGRAFNSLMLHRNGPYGHPSWKQVRVSQNPVTRAQITENMYPISFFKPSPQQLGTEPNTQTRYFTEVPVTSRFKPMVHVVDVGNANSSDITAYDVKIISTFGNNLTTFVNSDIDNLISYGKIDRVGLVPNTAIHVEPQAYNELINIYNDPEYASVTPIKTMKYFLYKENIFPRQHNTYRGAARGRTNYLERPKTFGGGIEVSRSFDRPSTEINNFWRSDITNRVRTANSASNSLAILQVTGGARSMWPLDGGHNTNSGSTQGADHATSYLLALNISGTAGELWQGATAKRDSSQNTIPTWMWITSPAPSYINTPYAAGVHTSPTWKTNILAKKEPFYDTYEEFAEDIRAIGQDHSVIPEFNISEHLDFYMHEKDGNFLAPNNKMFSIKGATVSQSATSESDDLDPLFYSTYLHADFMKHFGLFAEDHKTKQEISRVTLKCKGIKKLLPYNGFYPVNRTLQLASLLSKSYGPIIEGFQSASADNVSKTHDYSAQIYQDYAGLQTLLQTSYAPGIMYNSIKSGISVDWAAMTGTYNGAETGMSLQGVDFVSGSPNYRIPFENILDMALLPMKRGEQGDKIFLMSDAGAPTASVACNDWSEAKPNYTLATHNFLAETANLFLKEGKLNSIVSKPRAQWKSFEIGTTYYMDVQLKKTDNLVMCEGPLTASQDHPLNGLASYRPLTGPSRGALYGPAARFTLQPMYNDRAISGSQINGYINAASSSGGDVVGFGVNNLAVSGSNGGSEGAEKNDPAYAPWTPPYFYGASTVTLSYTAHTTNPTLDEIFHGAEFSASYSNDNTGIPKDGGYRPFSGSGVDTNNLVHDSSPAIAHRMAISSSINLFQKVFDKNVVYDAQGKALNMQDHQQPENFNRWAISPKMEFPVLNFSQSVNDGSPNLHTSVHHTGTTRGMWWGYGDVPKSDEGIYLSLKEYEPTIQRRFNPRDRTNKSSAANLTGSLIEQCGFSIPGAAENLLPSRKLGRMPQDFEKSISEAVVCIPFSRTQIPGVTSGHNLGGRYFFLIDNDVWGQHVINYENNSPYAIEQGQLGSDRNIDKTSISDLIPKMDKFILPPKFDFRKFPNNVPPIVMYMFEFEHKFTRQELVDIWQNVMPEISMNAEVEEVTLSHPTSKFEFFHGERPFSTLYSDEDPEVEWLVFKVKQKAKTNYYGLTTDTFDDGKFNFNLVPGYSAKTEPLYSYNWPYDFCSLVELGKIESSVKFGKERLVVIDEAAQIIADINKGKGR